MRTECVEEMSIVTDQAPEVQTIVSLLRHCQSALAAHFMEWRFFSHIYGTEEAVELRRKSMPHCALIKDRWYPALILQSCRAGSMVMCNLLYAMHPRLSSRMSVPGDSSISKLITALKKTQTIADTWIPAVY